MGWRGAAGNGAATIGTYFGFGGVLMILGSVGEVSDLKRFLTTPNACLTDNIRSGSSATPSLSSSLAPSVLSGSRLASLKCLNITLPAPSSPTPTQLEQKTQLSTQALVSCPARHDTQGPKLTSFALHRLIPALDGFPLLHLHDLCSPHQHRFRRHLRRPCPCLWLPRWRILAPRSRQLGYCRHIAHCRRCSDLHRGHPGMVDLLCHLTGFARLPLPAAW